MLSVTHLFQALTAWLVVAALLASGCGLPVGNQPTLVIFAGSASKPPLDELARSFEASHNAKVEITYGGSGTVLSQMILARTGDLYIPGSQDFMDTAESKGAVDPSTRKVIAYLLPAIAVPKGNPKNIQTLQDLARPGLRVGIGNPDSVCVGLFAVEIFKSAGIWDKVQPNVVVQAKSCEDTANVLVLGQVDAVIGWDVFDDWQPDKITIVPLPKEQLVKVGNIPVALSVYVKNRALAQDFAALVTGPEGKATFARYGYVVDPPAAASPAPTKVPATSALPTPAPRPAIGCSLRLATTTSTYDSGLLAAILPDFEKRFSCKVDVVAVGTGQAMEIGTRGDADVLLVHDRPKEDQFVKNGHARQRFDVMYNDFILLGPRVDPAKVAGMTRATDAFKAIASAKAAFASRGDKSGTNSKELAIWSGAGITPTKELAWYNALGQGMGETLLTSNEQGAYTMADRGTYLAMKDKLPNLMIVIGGTSIKDNADKDLLNPYGVMAVDPARHPGVNSEMAEKFVSWITSAETQKLIAVYGVDKYGQPLFYPNAAK